MDSTRICLAACSLGLLAVWPGSDAAAARILHKERLDAFAVKPVSALADGSATGKSRLAFDAFGRRFDLTLEPNRALVTAADRLFAARALGIYRGGIDGVDGSWVRLVVENGAPTGLVSDGDEIWAIETLTGEDGAAAPHMFRLADVHVDPGTLACTAEAPEATAATLVASLVAETLPLVERAAGATAEIDLAVMADVAFATAKGANSEAALIARVNNVDGIFSGQLGVQVNVGRIDTFDPGSEPFTNETNAQSLLGELADYRLATPEQRANGLSHLFTGRNLDGTTVGIAYGSAVCSARFGVGLTQGTHSTTIDSLIAAHEIGHNFGAPHDGTEGSVCEAEPQTFLMAPSINGSDRFSDCSIAEMQATIVSASCVEPLSSADLELVVVATPAAVLLGDSVDVAIEVNNVGSGTVDDAVVEVTLPSGAGLDSITGTGGICTSGGGVATCTIPAIAPGSGSTIDLAVTPLDAGTIELVATVAAAADENPSNDSVSVELTTSVAVDVAVSAPAQTEVEIGRTIALAPAVENRSSIAASGLAATVTAGTGLEIVEASWLGGPCVIDAGVASCEAAMLGSGESSAIALVMRGTSEAIGSYVVAVAPSEPDRVVANNSATGRITVTAAPVQPSTQAPPAAAGADGGGGVFGWPSVLLLVIAEWLHRRRRRLRRRDGCAATGIDGTRNRSHRAQVTA